MSTVAIEMEIKNRELDGKFWLALYLAQRGHRVALGHKSQIHAGLDLIEPDFFLAKEAFEQAYGGNKLDLLKKIKKAGARVLLLDAEGDAFFDGKRSADRVSERCLRHVDRVLAWGEVSARVFEDQSSFDPDKIVLTGNPRFDLYRQSFRGLYRSRSRELREQHGPYILVNTSFSYANPQDETELLDVELYEDDRYDRVRRGTFQAFLEMVPHLSKRLPDRTFLVRPHPSEDHRVYHRVLGDLDNVRVRHEGGVASWILGAEAVVHNGCTTGVESVLLGRPTFAYVPMEDEVYDENAPNRCSVSASDPDDLTGKIRSQLEGKTSSTEVLSRKRDRLNKYLWNVDRLAARRIGRVIETMQPRDGKQFDRLFPTKSTQRMKRFLYRGMGTRCMEWIRSWTRRTRDVQTHGAPDEFPGLSERELHAQLEDLKQLPLEDVSLSGIHLDKNLGSEKFVWVTRG